MKTILAPIDFSPVSDAVVKEATSLARALGGRVVLLTIVQLPVTMPEYSGLIDLPKLIAAGEKNAARQLAAIEQKLQNNFVAAESVQATGSPIAGILDQAKACEADYIVMGSHGHTAFYDLLVGSTTHGVLNRAKCPVVVVPAAKEAPKARKKDKRSTAV